jgi:signal transduction histidine kinase
MNLPDTAPMPRAKCLIVDDLEDNLVALEALLQGQQVELLMARSGREALELLLLHEVALALVDVQMPGMDGFELAELMRGSARTRHVPIIFLTATDRSALRTFRGYEAGAVDFLYKPFDAHILRSKVEVFIELQTGKLQLAEQLETVQQLLRTNEMLVAVLGHDLRNPLSAVMSSAELLPLVSTDERVVSAARRIQDSGARMSRMIEQLLDVARLRSGLLTLAPAQVDLAAICRDIVGEFTGAGGGPGREPRIEIKSVGDTGGHWDPDALAQVVSNLLGNALQHGARRQPVSVRLDGEDSAAVRLRVCNAGRIPEEVAANIFKPFYSAARTDRPENSGGGLGLGLYIVGEIVRLHGGRLDVLSSDEQGTVFDIVLPRSAAGARAGG